MDKREDSHTSHDDANKTRGDGDASPSANQSFAGDRQVTESFAREPTTDSFAGMSSEDVARYRAERDKLQRPLLIPRPAAGETAETKANIISKGFLFYLHHVQKVAETKDAHLELEDIDPVVADDRCELNHARFMAEWERELARTEAAKARGEVDAKPRIIRTLNYMCWKDIALIIFAMLFEMGLPFTTVILLKYINKYMLDPHAPLWHGAVFAVIIFFSQIIQSISTAQSGRFSNHLGIKFEGAIRMAVAHRTLRLTSDGFKACGGAGATFQIFSGDVGRLGSMLNMLYQGIALGIQALAAIGYLFGILTWPAFGAVAVFVILLPFNYRVSNSFIGVFIQKMIAGDKRTKKVVEILNNIRTVKFYGWEKPFVVLVAKLREPELVHTAELMRLIAFIMCSFTVASPLMQLAVYGLIIAKSPDQLNVVKFFQSLSLISILAGALTRLPWVYSSYLQILVSADRISTLLTADAREITVQEKADGGVTIDDATFVWSKEEAEKFKRQKEMSNEPFDLSLEMKQAAPTPPPATPEKTPAGGAPAAEAEKQTAGNRLQVHTFKADPGELVMVVGKLGGGKSALINAIIGEMRLVAGTCGVRGRIAYTPQQAWVINATIRNNIIMNNPFDEARYMSVILAVDLHVDFPALPNGDLTEIGEKGINLSGGQKQRVSLARALYTDADLYLFDDPLSALDAHVGRHVFEEAFTKLLAGKTRILVTHGMGYLSAADRVYISDNMHVDLVPTVPSAHALGPAPDAAAALLEPAMIQLLRAWHGTKNTSKDVDDSKQSPNTSTEVTKTKDKKKKEAKTKTSGVLTVQEERQSGQVSMDTLWLYLGSFGGPSFWLLILLLHVLVVGGNIFANLWLGFWSGGELPKSIQYKYVPGFYIGIYALVVVCVAIIALCREMIWRTGAVNAPRVIYKNMSDAVFHTSMAFFDTTPIGRIINRFTKDSEQLDFSLPMACNAVFIICMQQFGALVTVCYLMPWFSPVAAALILAMIFIQPTVATVVLRRLSSSLVGPTVALYSETVGGAACVRAAGLSDFFMARFAQTVDDSHGARMADQMLFQSVNVKVNFCMAFVGCGALLIIMATKDSLTPARASFIVSQVMNLTIAMVFMMFQRGQLALALNSIERLTEFSRLAPEPEGHEEPDASWPQKGEVEFDHLTAQYRPDKPLVLKDVCATIKAGEKVGVVGRTGSGKSSLLLTIFRLLPLLNESTIKIDGVDTASMPLSTLRSKLSAIPQEPVLFSGTVRENLDPFGVVDDALLRTALQQANLEPILAAKAADAKTEDYLSLMLTDSSLSIGEKQLLCLARALARNQRILVLDEATSSVDPHTDRLIQTTIRTAFAHCTVMTVAHRLNTIMDSDRILVLNQGSIVEFDSPARLLENPNGVFAQLVADAEREEGGEN
jgi:ABC-type multidrug transport system fused ATPase/permease subunit